LAKRIFEVARELGVNSKAVLSKCRAEGIEIKNHMSTVSAGLEATIREWFSEAEDSTTAVETTQHVDLEKARKEAKKSRRRRKTAKAKEAEAAEPEAPEEAPTVVETAPSEPQAPQPEAKPERAEEPSEAPAEAQRPAAEVQAPTEVQPEPAEPQAEEEAPEPIEPAGPQVVPKPPKLKGPRVVRVERPEPVGRGRPGPGRGAALRPTPPPPDLKEEAEAERRRRRKSKRRSPRRRTGRSAESGETVREWRNQDLVEREQRLAAASGGGLRRHRAKVSKPSAELRRPAGRPGKVEIEEPITVKSLSAATGIKSGEIIRKLMGMGVLATINQGLDVETAETIALEYNIELAVRRAKTPEQELLEQWEARPKGPMHPRAPVVTFLGHVDHGKTSLLDRIRASAIVETESGGITQHIGAYRYDKDNVQVVFLDTPGHEAFTAMRARGANMTDVVVLVVAADDGVMPQTVEAINHAKAAGAPIIVALNKIDVPNANVQRALGQLAEHDLSPRQWGGNTEVIQTSAVTGEGIDDLVELLSLEAQMLELQAEVDAPVSGYVVEARMDPGRGVVATLLIRNGTLKTGDIVLAGQSYGRVRQLLDDKGREVDAAGPSTPLEVSGLDELPQAGDRFYALEDLDQARSIAEQHRQQARSEQLAAAPTKTIESLMQQIQAGEAHELALIIKADVQGSVEAITSSVEKLSTDEVRARILHAAAGGITTGDVSLAEASGALIIGFNVVPDPAARQLAEAQDVEIRQYSVIYDIIEDVRRALEGGLAPELREETLGRAEVRQVFKISRIGTIAGCLVSDGTVARNAHVRVIRDNVVIERDRTLESLKRYKDDVREVRSGMECGVKIAGFDDIKEGDVLEFYRTVEVARTL